jgi:ribosomal protein L44E
MVRFCNTCPRTTNIKTIEKRARELEEAERLDDERRRLAKERQTVYDYTYPVQGKKKKTYNPLDRRSRGGRQIDLLGEKTVSFE